ncbi:protein WHI4 isoform X1 [Dioscorea cayenensis subsp. rotundata]|uniref:Protein WHI4 isoform X1 n=1 Tax=Dioscorea cayennensis subsp. rotundata TaxID=55577 RepID=A0AB40AMA9_DIOCR|nr:protein WHI4 isoform X1 [Dioscorea cayenensis subsp. rotundata]
MAFAQRSYEPKPPLHSPVPTTHPPPPHAGALDSSSFPPPPSYDSRYIHHHHQTAAVAPPLVHPNPQQQRIHTLFVSGLPDDVKPREIHNLFCRRPGFDHCLLEYTGRGNQVVAFATFSNHQSAMAAMNTLNGVIFDPQTGATLHIELARSNSRTKRPRGGGAYVVIDKRAKVSNDDHETLSDDEDGQSDEAPGSFNDDIYDNAASTTAESGEMAVSTVHAEGTSNEQLERPISSDIPPCSTLFIANLGPTCTEDELKDALSKFPGFHTLKMRGKGGMPVAFADFEDVESSTEAMNSLQGVLLESSDRGGLHLEYARSKMRKG